MSRNISIKEALGMATKTLVSNKLRSSLTMLGIIIGNASVITLVGLGRGAQTLAKNQLSNLGANVYSLFLEIMTQEEEVFHFLKILY